MNMNQRALAKLDIEKLHTESLQLRNQQFQLATIALAGSGVTAWIAPGIIAIMGAKGTTIPEYAIVVSILSWLALLLILYFWSLCLRTLISIISRYLECHNYSPWEVEFRRFQKSGCPVCGNECKLGRLYRSQTVATAWAFAAYGVLAVTGAIVTSCVFSEELKLRACGITTLIVFLVVYLCLIVVACTTRERGEAILARWRHLEGKTGP